MQKWFKPIAIILTLAIVIAFVLPSFKVTLANNRDQSQTVSAKQMLSLADVVKHGVVKNGSSYVLDESYAKSNGLSSTQINNLKDYLQKTPSNEIASVINKADEFKNTVSEYAKENGNYINISTSDKAFAWSWNDRMLEWARTIAWVFVGTQVAGLFLKDIYNYGFYRACHHFGGYSSIRTMCKATNHW